MNFSGRVMRCAVMGWALYLIIALSAFALHTHSLHEGGTHAPCALCLAQNVTGAAAVAATFALLIPVVRWNRLSWPHRFSAPHVAPQLRQHHPRGPPVELFFLLPD